MDSTGKIGNKIGGVIDNSDAVYVRKNSAAETRTEIMKRSFGSGLAGEDTVSLSIRESVQSAFGDDEEARKRKIAELKAQIEAGSYNVDSRLVAREVVSEIAQSIFFKPEVREDEKGSILP